MPGSSRGCAHLATPASHHLRRIRRCPKTNVSANDKSATITWATKKTSIESFTYKAVTPNACPAVSGWTKLLEMNETGSVSGGTATGMKGGKVSGKVCIYKKGLRVCRQQLGAAEDLTKPRSTT